ncbi:MAG: glucose 1-dehydrogenase [Oscillochloris sp.]|nr:glucose 1-dehydrogenase [Oscillochloris sp.]
MAILAGRVALITGGGSGIGAASAHLLARHGAKIVIGNRRVERGQAVAAAICADGGSAIFQATDVTDAAAVAALVRLAIDTYGRLDIAFNNAGGFGTRALLADQEPALVDELLAVNVRGTFLCMKYELQHMLAQGNGVIINNASTTGLRNTNPGVAIYAAAKSAVLSLTRSAALEYAERGIRVNAVAPGRIATEMLGIAGAGEMERFAAQVPLKRLGTPDEVAEAVLWLASDAAAFVTGHILAVDGGVLA